MGIQVKNVYPIPITYYYKEGNEYTSITGGYAITYTNNGTVNLTKNPGNMVITAYESNEGRGACCNQTAINVDNINTLYIDWTASLPRAGDYTFFGVALLNSNIDVITGTGTITTQFARRTDSIDVSGVSGNVYLKTYVYNVDYGTTDTVVTVYNIYGEK